MSGEHLRSHTRVIALCSAGLFVPLIVPILLGRLFTLNDLMSYHIPLRHLYGEALRAGDSLLWSPAIYSGLYFYGEGEVGMAHPLHLLLFRFLPLGLALNLEIISGYLAALVGTSLLLRRLGFTAEGASFGAMLFAFCGFNVLHLIHVNAIEIIGHIPWILLAVHVLLTTNNRGARAGAFAGAAVLLGSQLLLGYPQYVWLTLLAVGYLTVCLLISGAPLSRVPLLFVALVAGVFVGGIQVLPTLDVLEGSMRSAPSADFRMTFSLNPLNLIQVFSPFAFENRIYAHPDAFQVHESSVYNGAVCTISLAWLAIRDRAITRRRLLAALLVAAAMSLILALGRYGGVYPWISALPGVSSFRAPARHVLLLHFAVSGLAALAFEDIAGLVRRRETLHMRQLWPLAIPVALSVVITGIVSTLASSPWPESLNLYLSDLLLAGPWSAVLVLTAALFVMAGRGVRWAVPLLAIVAALDLGTWGYSYLYSDAPLQTVREIAASAQVPPEAAAGDLFEPPIDESVNVGVMTGLRVSAGYMALVPVSVLAPADPVTQQIAGVSWRKSADGWARIPGSMPRARLLPDARASENIRADVRTIDISATALINAPIGELSGAPGVARIIADRPGRIVVETVATGRQLLVVTERFHEGWRATEDGRDSRPIPVYGDFLGCVVSPGTHRVTLEFAPSSLRNGARLTLAGVALTTLVTLVVWRRPRRDQIATGGGPTVAGSK